MRRRLPSFSLAMAVAAAALPRPAAAYVCSRVEDPSGADTGASLWWSVRLIEFALFSAGTADVAGSVELDVLRDSFRPWGRYVETTGAVTGTPPQEDISPYRSTDLEFREAPALSTRDAVGYDFLHPEDNENLLIFRDDVWPDPAQARTVIALTTTTYNALTGEILDADIEFNSARCHFTVSNTPGANDTDVMNTAVHEIGHLLGLAHSPVQAATMSPTADGGEISKRVLDRDDRNAIVFKYPAGAANGFCDATAAGCTCPPPGTAAATVVITAGDVHDGLGNPGGCGATGPAPALAALAAALGAARRRRGRGDALRPPRRALTLRG